VGIAGVRLPTTRIEGKRKMSQNWNAQDRAGVAAGLAVSGRVTDREVAALMQT
jgi:transcriptional regulator